MKTEFALTRASGFGDGTIKIIGKEPKNKPYVSISLGSRKSFIQDKDLERFALNILKSINSKHIKKLK